VVQQVEACDTLVEIERQGSDEIGDVKGQIDQLRLELRQMEMTLAEGDENAVGCGHESPEEKHCYQRQELRILHKQIPFSNIYRQTRQILRRLERQGRPNLVQFYIAIEA
jgi:hypothetical protein